MNKYFFTCGQNHSHQMSNGRIWNKDSVLQVNAKTENDARVRVWEMFGDQWCNSYTENTIDFGYYPNGICAVIHADF